MVGPCFVYAHPDNLFPSTFVNTISLDRLTLWTGPRRISAFKWGRSSVGRAIGSQSIGRRFDPARLHKSIQRLRPILQNWPFSWGHDSVKVSYPVIQLHRASRSATLFCTDLCAPGLSADQYLACEPSSRLPKSCSHSDSLILTSTTSIFRGSTFFRRSNAPIVLTSVALLSFPDLLSTGGAPSAALPLGKSSRFTNRHILLFQSGGPNVHVCGDCRRWILGADCSRGHSSRGELLHACRLDIGDCGHTLKHKRRRRTQWCAVFVALPWSYFFRLSRISRNNTMSSGVAGGGAGGSALRRRFICLTIMKMMNARMMKFTRMVMKLP